MQVEFSPSKAVGEVLAPPSKSYAIRLILASALSDEKCTIKGYAPCDDIDASLLCAKALGSDIEIKGDTIVISRGIPSKIFPCNESASVLRLYLPASVIKCGGGDFLLSNRLFERGISIYEDVLNDCTFKKFDNHILVNGNISSKKYFVLGDVSSQYISGLLFALPLLKDDSEIIVTTPLVSYPYVNITLDVLKTFGIKTETSGNRFYVCGNQKFKSTDTEIEKDFSNASCLYAFNHIGGNVSVKGLKENSKQGDSAFFKYFDILNGENAVIDISNTPDLAPILFALASLKNGGEFLGVKRLREKESDRCLSMQKVLSQFGISSIVSDDKMIIKKGKIKKPDLPVFSYNDHRIAMAVSLLLSVTGGFLDGIEAVNKSYPSFFKDLISLGIDIK